MALYPDWGGVHSPGRHPSGKDPSSPQKDEKGVTEREGEPCVPGKALAEGSIPGTEWCLVWLDCNSEGRFVQDESRSQPRPEHTGLAGHLRAGA